MLNHSIDDNPVIGGFATVDDKGRISLSKPVRAALGVEAGSSMAYIVLDGALLLTPRMRTWHC